MRVLVLHNRYRLDKLLKMGGFGAVYKATDTKVNKPATRIGWPYQ